MAKTYVDYFNPKDVNYQYVFPDGLTKFVFRALKEGDRAWVQNQRSVIEVDNATKRMKMDAGNGTFKTEIIARALVDWDMQSKSKDGKLTRVPFEVKNVNTLLENLDPLLVDEIFSEVENNNSWLKGAARDLSTIRKEIKALEAEQEEKAANEKK